MLMKEITISQPNQQQKLAKHVKTNRSNKTYQNKFTVVPIDKDSGSMIYEL